jgi:hypothetical protein
MNGSTILTIGTALNRAQQAGAQVFALVQGQWIAGHVLGIDGHGVVLRNSAGESAVLRLEHVAAVRIDEAAVADPTDESDGQSDGRPDEQQVFTMGAGEGAPEAPSAAQPTPVGVGLAIAHPAELSA